MKTSIKLSIPTPCHEDWAKMTPEGRGRFCAACQKTVTDFTKATDREIITAYNQDAKLCGRFLSTQLDRELVIPKEKKGFWGAAAAIVILSMINTEAVAQTPISTEQMEKQEDDTLKTPDTLLIITGTVFDSDGMPLPGAALMIENTRDTAVSNMDGTFAIKARVGDTLHYAYATEEGKITITQEQYNVTIVIKELENLIVIGQYIPKRTFFGRIFHSIGNIFR